MARECHPDAHWLASLFSGDVSGCRMVLRVLLSQGDPRRSICSFHDIVPDKWSRLRSPAIALWTVCCLCWAWRVLVSRQIRQYRNIQTGERGDPDTSSWWMEVVSVKSANWRYWTVVAQDPLTKHTQEIFLFSQ